MPPQRRRRLNLRTTVSPEIQIDAPRRTRSGKIFAAAHGDSPPHVSHDDPPRVGPAVGVGPLTPSPPRTRAGGKRKVFIVDSEVSDAESNGRRRRRRRGAGPRSLTVLPDQTDPDKTPPENNDFVFSGVGNNRMPNRTVNFPWGFSIPLTETGRADREHPHFARVQEEDMKLVLTQVGCSVGGKTKNQLVDMCVVYADLIQALPVPIGNSPPSNTPQPALPGSSQAIPFDSAIDESRSQRSNSNHDADLIDESRSQRSNSNHDADLIQFTSPTRLDTNTSRPNGPLHPAQSAAAPSFLGPAGQHLEEDHPSSLPALTPDVPRNHSRDSDNESPLNHAQLSSQESQMEIIQLLKVHSRKISAMQDDIASTLRHQQEIKGKLEEISDKLQYSRVSTTRDPKPKPTKSSASQAFHRTGKLKLLIQHHFAALFGLPEGSNQPPPPPTASEKKRWLKQSTSAPASNSDMECDPESDINSSGNREADAQSSGDCESDAESSRDRESDAESAGDRESDADYSGSSDRTDSGSDADATDTEFPHRGGPGHRWASQEQLKIMRDMMKARNMRRFRMDLALPLSAPENIFCLELARDIFVALLECGEYDGLQPHESKPEFILQQMRNHVKDVFVQGYRERVKWPSQKQSARAQQQSRNSRRKNIKNVRLRSALEIGGLNAFLPIIRKCCSDDETDNEVPPQSHSTSTPVGGPQKRPQKYCKIRRLPWRSEEVSEAFKLLDDYRDRQEAGRPQNRKGAKPRLRRRPPQLKDSHGRPLKGPTDSDIKPVKGLPEEVYDKDWIKSQSTVVVKSLRLSSLQVLQNAISKLKSVV